MKKLFATAASVALAGLFSASDVLADEPFCATINSIHSITLDDDDLNPCQLVLSLTLPSGQQYTLDVETAGTQLCNAFEVKHVTNTAGFQACGFYVLKPFYVYISEITQTREPPAI